MLIHITLASEPSLDHIKLDSAFFHHIMNIRAHILETS